jgi:hypothetical protein
MKLISHCVVVFDTGSADLIIPNDTCAQDCELKRRYYHHLSHTSKDQGRSFSLSVVQGSGDVSGGLYTDSVFVGGFEVSAYMLGSLMVTEEFRQ